MPHRFPKLAPLLLGCLLTFWAALPSAAQSNYSESELDTLVGPIALYPDPLLSNVIKASTFPDQVAQAAKTPAEDSSWDDSVKAVHAYPDAMTLMGANPDWTRSLGWAATHQLHDLTDAVQRFRYRAQQAGNLSSGSQMLVIQEGTTIRIEPANPQVIYVPTYDPNDVDQSNFGTGFFFGAAVASSAYLWTNMYHWNTGAFYTRPYGWYPPAAYYRPYGWQGAGIYNPNNVARIGNTTINRGGVTINNVNYANRNKLNTTRVQTGNVRSGNRVQGQSPLSGNRNFTQVENRNSLTRPETPTRVGRPPVAAPNVSAGSASGWSRGSSSQWRSSTPHVGSYSSSGQAVRQSSRGAESRGSRSVSSGASFRGRAGGGRGGRR